MQTISYIETDARKNASQSINIPTDESVGMMIFDIGGFANPFDGHQTIYNNFHDNTVQAIKNLDEAEVLGLTDRSFLNGLVAYHLSDFYDFIGGTQLLYVALCDCSKGWGMLPGLQRQTSGRVFHMGIWTHRSLWKSDDGETLAFTSLIRDLQLQADAINGKVGEPAHSMTPLSIVLFGNTRYVPDFFITHKKLPNAKILDCPKVTAVLAQNGSDTVHRMQENNPANAPVTAMGLVMGCLAVCGAEEPVSSVNSCDLNKNERFNSPELAVGINNTPSDSLTDVWKNTLSSKGYVFPVSYESIEAGYFLSSDQTLSEGDFGSLSSNRIIHKCRRAIDTALLPHVEGNVAYNPGTGRIDESAATILVNSVYTVLDSVMRNRRGLDQLDARNVTVLDNADILDNDSLRIHFEVKAVDKSEYLSEVVSHDFD